MSFCINCGSALTEGTRFCAACGSPIGADSGDQPQPPADQAATQVTPPGPDQAATQVMPPQGPAATQAMAGVGGPVAGMPPVAPPVGPPLAPSGLGPGGGQPFGYGGQPPAGASRKKLWIGLGIAAAVIAIVLIVWLVNPFNSGGDKFVGSWAPVDDSGGGLVIDDGPDVWFVDPSGTRYGPMNGKVKGDTLSFEMSPDMAEQMGDETGLSAALVPKFEARYDDKSGHLFLTMSAAGMEADQIELKKVESLETSSPSPTPSETETPSPTPTVTVTETPSPTSSPSPTDTAGPDAFKDNQVRNGADVIADAIDDYTTDNTALPPTPLGPGGGSLDAYLPAGSWPENPFTETPMTEGSGWGDFDYNDNGDGSYTLLAHLSDGSDYDITRTP